MFNYKFPDERTEFITYKAGCYSFLIMTFLYLTLQVAQGFQLFGYLPVSQEVLYGLSMIPFFASAGFFVVYLWRNKIYESEREMLSRSEVKRKKIKIYLIAWSVVSLISTIAMYYYIMEFSFLKAIISGLIYIAFVLPVIWSIYFRKTKDTKENL